MSFSINRPQSLYRCLSFSRQQHLSSLSSNMKSKLFSSSSDENKEKSPLSSNREKSTIIQSKPTPPQGEAWKHGYFPTTTPELITFDATDTLIELRSDVGMFYREVLHKATDYNAKLPGPECFTNAFIKAYKNMDVKNPCFGGCGQGMSSREWWKKVVYDTYANVDISDPNLRAQMDDWLLPEVFETLYTDVFVTDEAWALREGALEVLNNAVAWRDGNPGRKPALGVLSNFDERLHSIFKNLEIYNVFDIILTSREIGVAKPEQRAFEVAMSRMGITDASQCMHVGNTFKKDIIGASQAGWHAVYIPATGECMIPENTDPNLVFSMVNDLHGVLRMFGKESGK